ncbi:MAG TPA: MFS transporter [Sporichthyaceae bacterium]|nr:MFS transporter [Sporichthyaceae bacterium]
MDAQLAPARSPDRARPQFVALPRSWAPISAAAHWEPDKVHRRRWATLGVMCLSLTLIGLDNTVLNVALPTLVRDLHATGSQLQWIVDSYTLIFAGLLLTAGTLGDRFGRRRALFVGMTIFGLSSLWAAWAAGADQLIAARAFMGIGAAAIMPATLSIIITVFTDPAERAKAIGIWAAVAGLGIIGGPSLGGWLLMHFWWGSVFLINVPVAVGTVALGRVLVPESRDPAAPRADLIGMASSVAGLAALVWAFIQAPVRGWTDPLILLLMLAGAGVLVVFVLWERRTAAPMLDMGFFRDRDFSVCSAVISLASFALVGALFFLSQYLQFVLGYNALGTGARLLPFATMALGAPLGIVLSQRHATKFAVAPGLAVTSLGLSLIATITPSDGYPKLGLALGIIGFGVGMAMAPATDAVMASLPAEKAGIGSAVNDTARQVGGALGVAVLGSLLAARYADGLSGQLDETTVPAAARGGIGQTLAFGHDAAGADAAGVAGAAATSFVHAMDVTVLAAAGVVIAGAVVAAVWLPARQPRRASVLTTGQLLSGLLVAAPAQFDL